MKQELPRREATPVKRDWAGWHHAFIARVDLDSSVTWETQHHKANLDYFQMLLLRVTWQIQNPRQEEVFAFSEATRYSQCCFSQWYWSRGRNACFQRVWHCNWTASTRDLMRHSKKNQHMSKNNGVKQWIEDRECFLPNAYTSSQRASLFIK